jgi:hypothetical protein
MARRQAYPSKGQVKEQGAADTPCAPGDLWIVQAQQLGVRLSAVPTQGLAAAEAGIGLSQALAHCACSHYEATILLALGLRALLGLIETVIPSGQRPACLGGVAV